MSLFDDIPDDPELAFLELEKRFSQELARTLNESFGDSDSTEDYLRYMSRTLAAKQALGLSVLGDWSVPAAPNFSIDLYRISAVTSNITGLLLKFATAGEIRA